MTDAHLRIARSLAAVSPDDRRWLLKQLDQDDRTRVLASLSEFSAPDAVSATSRANTAAIGVQSAGHSDEDRETVDSAAPELIGELLKHEPVWIVATILTFGNWDWADAFLATCPPRRLEQITQTMRSSAAGVKPRFRQTLLALLAQRVRAHAPQRPKPLPFENMLNKAERRLHQAWSQTRTDES